jgi:hypothetical protein
MGIVLGAVFGFAIVGLSSAASPCTPDEMCEGMGYAIAMAAAPVLGAIWGALAGLIGGLIGLGTRSRIGYTSTMTALAVVPLLAAAVLYVRWGEFLVWSLLFVLGAGLIVWWISWKISRRLTDP